MAEFIGSKAKLSEQANERFDNKTRRKVIVIKARSFKRPLNGRRTKVASAIPARNYKNKGFKRPIKPKRAVPKKSPEPRHSEATEESDTDILNVTEDIEIDSASPSIERGRLLRLSTLKPKAGAPPKVLEVDPIPERSTDTTKRIVRIVKRPSHPTSLDIEVQSQTTREIGVQFGIPLGEYLRRKRESAPPVVAPGPDAPLQGFWTHKVNLPYPPQGGDFGGPQFVIPQQQQAQQQQQAFYQTAAPQQQFQQQQQAFYQPAPYNQVVYLPPKNYSSGQFMNRRQRRNYQKSQRQQQRRAE